MADSASQIFAAPAVAVRGPLLGNLFCVLSMALWAMGFPAIDTLVGRVPPLPMTALRMGLAVAFLLPIWALVEGKRGVMSARWWQGLWVACWLIWRSLICLRWGQPWLPVGQGSLLGPSLS